jgi:TIR domain
LPIDPSTAFVSYSREDMEFALRLAKDLKAKGAKVWMDKLDIRAGRPWDDEIEAAV